MSDPPGVERPYQIDDEWSEARLCPPHWQGGRIPYAVSTGRDAPHRLRLRSRFDYR